MLKDRSLGNRCLGPHFCIVGSMRSGSNFLQSLLHNSDELVCYGEVFNKGAISKHSPINVGDFPSIAHGVGLSGAAEFIEKLDEMAKQSRWGFRIFEGHNASVLHDVLDSSNIQVIVLRRNYLASFCSLINAQLSGQWRLAYESNRKPALEGIEVNVDEFVEFCLGQSSFYTQVRERLVDAGKQAFFVSYEDMVCEREWVHDLGTFLNLKNTLNLSSVDTLKQIQKPIQEFVFNYSELEKQLLKKGYSRFCHRNQESCW